MACLTRLLRLPRPTLLIRRGFMSIKKLEDAINVDLIGQELRVSGWIQATRKLKVQFFLDLDDGLKAGGQRLQVVLKTEDLSETLLRQLRFHSAVCVEGTLLKSTHPAQEVELEAKHIHVLSECSNDSKYPLQPKRKRLANLERGYPHFRCKTKDFSALMRIRNGLSQGIHGFLQENQFIQVQTPILTSNDCEGAGEVFQVQPVRKFYDEQEMEVPYFFQDTFLTVSGQLHLEAICNGIARVYNFSPVFRAERGRSRRHLTEFSMIEGEVAFVDDIGEIMNLIENMMKYSISHVLKHNERDIQLYTKTTRETNWDNVLLASNHKFLVMTYDEAFEVLRKNEAKLKSPPIYGKSLVVEHERFIVEHHCNHVPVFITQWPKDSKAFYSRIRTDNPDYVDAVDLLLPGIGELCGGSLREHRHDVLQNRIAELGSSESEAALKWYLAMRRYGSAPTGGFGLGFERWVQFLLGVQNIKDTLPFPRSPHYSLL
ncbi:probable asparagine--tRNA ligase, mitochondrial [Tigriopus californicus]|uniref:probable asparagine--tRNA ligase, mitochondrial n=1 Tax=Tigriopus californicus TaxID=6832 RepID=UPI0027DA9623|nr:probable asparagine--tRNA ligase, mitochondrial [Tigriopus californicus]